MKSTAKIPPQGAWKQAEQPASDTEYFKAPAKPTAAIPNPQPPQLKRPTQAESEPPVLKRKQPQGFAAIGQ